MPNFGYMAIVCEDEEQTSADMFLLKERPHKEQLNCTTESMTTECLQTLILCDCAGEHNTSMNFLVYVLLVFVLVFESIL